MRRKLGILLIVLGCGLLIASFTLFLKNQQEQMRADIASQEAIIKVVDEIRAQDESDASDAPLVESAPVEEQAMTVADIDGYGYIGFLGIPSLELELPVMADWSYPQLQIAPCRYSGTTFLNDIVIMAHNYSKHFGKLQDLHTGDLITFTDMDGNTIQYEVVALDILAPTAVEDMTSGDYDLTLFTCTYGGQSRVTVRCDRTRT